MNISARIKIILQIKRFSDLELDEIAKMINDEQRKRRKNLLKHK